MLPCPSIHPAHRLPAGSAVWLVPSPAPCTLVPRPMCLPFCFANLANRPPSGPTSGHTISCMTLHTTTPPQESVFYPNFFLLSSYCGFSITSKEGTVVTEAFALYRICFYFPKFVSRVETPELRQRAEAGQGCPKLRGLSLHFPETSEPPL